MFVFRQVRTEDFDALLSLAKHLGTAGNIPAEPEKLREQIERSAKSFKKPSSRRADNLYMFVLEDYFRKIIVGSSLIFAKHGTRQSPHTYLEILNKTHQDPSTNIQVQHSLLRFEFDTDGPSEIGGLILHPDYRSSVAGLGAQLSYSRFIYMGMFPDRFEENVIAELLPPFNEEGSSELWEAFGKRFTGLSYKEADHLSRTNKDFIKSLFPREDIYTCLFSQKAQDEIGQTNRQTAAAKVLLEKIGFSFLNAVDPFDGGPHYGARVSEVTLVKRMESVNIDSKTLDHGGNRVLLGFIAQGSFHCLLVHVKWLENSSKIMVSEDVLRLIDELAYDASSVVTSPLL